MIGDFYRSWRLSAKGWRGASNFRLTGSAGVVEFLPFQKSVTFYSLICLLATLTFIDSAREASPEIEETSKKAVQGGYSGWALRAFYPVVRKVWLCCARLLAVVTAQRLFFGQSG